jgi:hypothetical protein
MIPRGFRDVGLGLVGLVLLVVALLMLGWTVGLLTYATRTVELPNGAVVARAFDWNLRPRADLWASYDGPLLVRDIDMICWDETTIDGFTSSIRRADGSVSRTISFLWTKGEEKALTSESPDYLPRVRDSSLSRNAPGCLGRSGGFIGGELLLRDPSYASRTARPPPSVWEATLREAWMRSAHRFPPRPAGVER